MQLKKLILLIDFTGVSQLAVEHAAIIARQSVCLVTLLHIADASKKSEEKEIKSQIREFANHLEKEGISFAIQINYGSFFDVIADSIQALNSDMIIIGTHGIKGINHNFVSSNISRLIKLISIPAFIVQGHSQPPPEGYSNILLPMIDIKETQILEKPVELFASIFKSKLFFLTYHNKENIEEFTKNAKEHVNRFKELGFSTNMEMEETSVYTSSYAKSIVQYADIEDIDVIALVFHESGDMKNFDTEDMENILLNRLGKPVLCV